jgi:hypothetical protein
MLKGTLTWVPALNALRMRRAATGGSDSARYCYSVWMRHLRNLEQHGFQIQNASVGELGPGDSIGLGFAALLSGVSSYVGLDIVPFSLKADLIPILEELERMFRRREAIPDDAEFPGVRPKLASYEFPEHLLEITDRDLDRRIQEVRRCLKPTLDCPPLTYSAPWTSLRDATFGKLDVIVSQAVLEHVDSLPEIYRCMFAWLKPGGLGSHVIDFSAHYLSPYWNGHWAYADWQWKLVRGQREFLLNRQPLSVHVKCATEAGFEVAALKRDYDDRGLSLRTSFSREDLRTRGAVLILRKPHN